MKMTARLVGAFAFAFSAASTAAPVINSVLTSYSSTGVPTAITIFGTGLCAASTCTTKPAVTLGGTALSPVSGTVTGITAPLGVIADGDYVLKLTAGSTSATYNLTIHAKVAGAPGPQGPAGPVGPAGAQGPTGPQGPAGNNGADGARGPAGADGAPGAAGATGATGPSGPQGPQGDTGDAGATGATGPQGATGAPGRSLVWKGLWVSTAAYEPNDVVYSNEPDISGGLCQFVAVTSNSNTKPRANANPQQSTFAWLTFDAACRSMPPPLPTIAFKESFETPVVTNGLFINVTTNFIGDSGNTWTVDSGDVDVQAALGAVDGKQSMDVNGWNPGVVHTDIPLEPGNYLLQFSYRNSDAGVGKFAVSMDGSAVTGSPFQAAVTGSFTAMSIPFTLTGTVGVATARRLTFTGFNGGTGSTCICNGVAIDNLKIVRQ